MKPVRTHTFSGQRYRIEIVVLRHVEGDIDQPRTKGKTIRIKKGLRGVQLLEVLVHEALHACFPELSEEAVERAGHDISTFVHRHGFQQVEE